MSSATNLVANDTNGWFDVFAHDMQTGVTSLVSLDSSGIQGNNHSFEPSVSADARYIAFSSDASNLISSDGNGTRDIFVRDMQTQTTTLASLSSMGVQANDYSEAPSISGDGRFVAFVSSATNLVANDTNNKDDVFVHDMQTGATTRVSVSSIGNEGDGTARWVSISADGRYVAFESDATNLVSGDTNNTGDVYIYDMQTGTTSRESVSSTGIQANGGSGEPSLSHDGRYIVFSSSATNLVSGAGNGWEQVYVRDRQAGTTAQISVASDGTQADGAHSDVRSNRSISGDGSAVAFGSGASNLVPNDTNASSDIFVRNWQALSPTLTPTNTSTTNTPTYTATPTSTPTNTPTATSMATNTSTSTPAIVPTPTPPRTPTATIAVPTITPTSVPTNTPFPSDALPTGSIVYPAEGQKFGQTVIQVQARASDDKGVQEVRFYVFYDHVWHQVGIAQTPDATGIYQVGWPTPASLGAQGLTFSIHVVDTAGQVTIDAGGVVKALYRQSYTDPTVHENWVQVRSYLNQVALQPGGDPPGSKNYNMCNGTSAAMVLAMNGFIQPAQMAEKAKAIWEATKPTFGAGQIENIINNMGLGKVAKSKHPGSYDNAWSILKKEIDANRVLVTGTTFGQLTLAGHYIVIVGYIEKGANRQIIAYDPYGRWLGQEPIQGVPNYDRNSEDVASQKGKWVIYDFSKVFDPGSNDFILIYRATNAQTIQADLDNPPDTPIYEPENPEYYPGVPGGNTEIVLLPLVRK